MHLGMLKSMTVLRSDYNKWVSALVGKSKVLLQKLDLMAGSDDLDLAVHVWMSLGTSHRLVGPVRVLLLLTSASLEYSCRRRHARSGARFMSCSGVLNGLWILISWRILVTSTTAMMAMVVVVMMTMMMAMMMVVVVMMTMIMAMMMTTSTIMAMMLLMMMMMMMMVVVMMLTTTMLLFLLLLEPTKQISLVGD